MVELIEKDIKTKLSLRKIIKLIFNLITMKSKSAMKQKRMLIG